MAGITKTKPTLPPTVRESHVQLLTKTANRKSPPKFAIGFADEIETLASRLDAKGGEIEIPNGNDWLVREIYEFSRTLTETLLDPNKIKCGSFWKDDLLIGLKEALANSFGHAVRQGGKVWVRWTTNKEAFVFEIEDEGNIPFDTNSKSSLNPITDIVGDPLCGRGIGMGYIISSADMVEVVPIMSKNGERLFGNKMILTKYFKLPY